VLENPKVRIHIGDAREVLLTTRQRYDVIFSEPSNPYRAGIASLFTQEFYRAVAERLNGRRHLRAMGAVLRGQRRHGARGLRDAADRVPRDRDLAHAPRPAAAGDAPAAAPTPCPRCASGSRRSRSARGCWRPGASPTWKASWRTSWRGPRSRARSHGRSRGA
jgi:hypothetical protein